MIGFPAGTMLEQHSSVLCPGNYIWRGVSSVRWLYSPDGNNFQPLNINTDDNKLTTDGFKLMFHNITGTYEGAYQCQAQYQDGSISYALPAECMFVAGKRNHTI